MRASLAILDRENFDRNVGLDKCLVSYVSACLLLESGEEERSKEIGLRSDDLGFYRSKSTKMKPLYLTASQGIPTLGIDHLWDVLLEIILPAKALRIKG